jgi:hypothetical protein
MIHHHVGLSKGWISGIVIFSLVSFALAMVILIRVKKRRLAASLPLFEKDSIYRYTTGGREMVIEQP